MKKYLISFLFLFLIGLTSAACDTGWNRACSEPGYQYCWEGHCAFDSGALAEVKMAWAFVDGEGTLVNSGGYAVKGLYVKSMASGYTFTALAGFKNKATWDAVWANFYCNDNSCGFSSYDFLPSKTGGTYKVADVGQTYKDCIALAAFDYYPWDDYAGWAYTTVGYGWVNTGNCVSIQVVDCVDNGDCATGLICDSTHTCKTPCIPYWTCTAWSSCTSGQQTRTCTDSNNCGVTTDKPGTTQSCCAENWQCSAWSTCRGNPGQQIRTCTDSNNCGTTATKPIVTQTCSCVTNWTCGSWSTCSNNLQSRTCTDSNNCGTTTGKPITNQSCGSSCVENWTCNSWGACNSSNKQTRTCTDSKNCGTTTTKPSTIQSCGCYLLGVQCTTNTDCCSNLCSGTGTKYCVNNTCIESWTCGSWSTCSNNLQTRTCTDSKNCGTTVNKPLTSQSCSTCGDGTCQSTETVTSCPEDCGEENKCEVAGINISALSAFGVVDIDGNGVKDCKDGLIIVIAVILIIIIIK